ncbi:MAG: phosphate ABC transporter permease PstA [Kiloniellales bacterium]|nr:phosphate ABC transporter permease PstA [Kiloniellales bacterium]
MTDIGAIQVNRPDEAAALRRLEKRKAAERRFRLLGLGAIFLAIAFLVLLIGSIVLGGYGAFIKSTIVLDVELSEETIDPEGTRDAETILRADYQGLIKDALRATFPEVTSRKDKKRLNRLISNGASFELAEEVVDNPSMIGTTQTVKLPASDLVNSISKGYISRDPESESFQRYEKEIAWLDRLKADGRLIREFNDTFFTSGDSREPELAGVLGAVVGSLFTLVVTLLASFPIAVLAAIYLEEFAPKNRWTDLIEVNINNLAAVPSVIFGLLGLAVFLNVFGMPRSAPLVGGLVLSLLTLPTIIIAGRAALKAVPPSIREAALGMGASPVQTTLHHTLPLAMPGILTGTIIGMAGALGETAPLLMIGMVAFIVDIPGGPTDPSTVLPVQIFLWADAPERGYVEKTNAAIMVLLAFLIMMNAFAIFLRKRFERRW